MFVALFLFLAGLIQGMTSFGFSMVAIPLLSFFLDMKVIVPMLVLYSLVINTIILMNLRRHLKPRQLVLLIISAIATTPLGVYILLLVSSEVLIFVASLLIITMALSSYFGFRMTMKNDRMSYVVAGSISGILNGSVSLSGPPIILFMAQKGYTKQQFRANLTFYFWVLNIVTIVMMVYKDVINSEVMTLSLTYLPMLVAGVVAGVFLGNRIDEELFRKGVVVLLIILGITNIVKLFV